MRSDASVASVVTAVALSALLAACSSSVSDEHAGTPETSKFVESDSLDAEMVDLLDIDLIQDLRNIQLAVDLSIEEGVAECMRAEGFDYVPRSADRLRLALSADPLGLGRFPGAQYALWDLGLEEPPQEESFGVGPDPNTAIVESFDEAERSEWDGTLSDCMVHISAQRENPLTGQDDWFEQASIEAGYSTSSDPQFVESEAAANRCFSERGWDDLATAQNDQTALIDAIRKSLANDDTSRDDAREALSTLAAEAREMSDAFDDCWEPHLMLEKAIFDRYLLVIAEQESDLAALWAAEIRTKMAVFADHLAAVREDE